MKIVVGLGNPGREYAATRHNLGFMVVEDLARRLNATTARPRFRSELAEATHLGDKVVLVKPQTYMNLSGQAAREVAHWYRVAANDVLIVLDDLDLPFASVRLREKGSAGGHNGLASIIEQLGTADVPRLRIGIGRSAATARTQVLSRFTSDEAASLPDIVQRSADCCLVWLEAGIITAMNRCNQKPEPEPLRSGPDKPPPAAGLDPNRQPRGRIEEVCDEPPLRVESDRDGSDQRRPAKRLFRGWWRGQEGNRHQ